MARSEDVRIVTATISYNGITIPGVSVDVVEAPSASKTWAVETSDLSIGLGVGLKPERFSFGSVPAKTATIAITTEDGTITHNNLVLLNRSPVLNADGSGSVILSGQDLSYIASLDNKTKETYEDTFGDDIIIDMLSDAGIANYSFAGSLSTYLGNFPIMQMDVQRDRYINRIQTLLNECGAVWRMDNNQFRMWIPSNTATVAKTFDSGDIYDSLRFQESVIELFDKVKVTRLNKNADVALQTSGTSSGRPNSALTGTFYQLHFSVIDDTGCNVTDVEWFKDGISVGGGFNIVGPADEVYYTVNAVSSPLFYEVKVTGTPEAMLGSGIDIGAEYEATLPGTTGDNPAPDIQSNFTPNDTLAELKAKAFLREQGSLRTTMTVPTKIQFPKITLEDRVGVDIDEYSLSWDCNVTGIRTFVRPNEAWQEFDLKVYEV